GRWVERVGDWVSLKSSILWYPRHDFDGRTNFELVYHVPATYQFVSVGEKVASETARDVTTTRWVTKEPIWKATLNLGFFKTYEVRDPRAPLVRVMLTNTTEAGRTESLARSDNVKGGNIDR